MADAIPTEYEIDESDDVRRVIVEKHVHTQVQEPKSSAPAFVAGFLFAALAAAIGAIVFLAVSDRDDDGNINLDVPGVEVDVDEDPGNG